MSRSYFPEPKYRLKGKASYKHKAMQMSSPTVKWLFSVVEWNICVQHPPPPPLAVIGIWEGCLCAHFSLLCLVVEA